VWIKYQVAIVLALVHGTVATRTKDALVHVLWELEPAWVQLSCSPNRRMVVLVSVSAFICERLPVFVIFTCPSSVSIHHSPYSAAMYIDRDQGSL